MGLGLSFFGIGVFLIIYEKRREKRCSEEIIGRIVDYQSREKTVRTDSGSRTSVLHYPVVEYILESRPVRACSLDGSTAKRYELDEEVLVRYNPEDPEEMILPTRKTMLVISWMFVISGVLSLVFTYVFVPILSKM